MAYSRAARDLENMINCGICLDQFNKRDPRALSCLHVFCRACLQRTYSTRIAADPESTGSLNCPVCTQTTHLPEGQVSGLVSYFAADQVSEVLDTLAQAKASVKCTRCSKGNEPVAYCFDCIHMLCQKCQERHNTKRQNSTHCRVDVSRATADQLQCEVHGEFIVQYCSTCKTVVCETCQVESHQDHTFVSFTMKSRMETGSQRISNAKDKQAKLSENAARVYEEIDQRVSQIMESVSADAESLKSQVQDILMETDSNIKQFERDTRPILSGFPQLGIPNESQSKAKNITINAEVHLELNTSAVYGLIGGLSREKLKPKLLTGNIKLKYKKTNIVVEWVGSIQDNIITLNKNKLQLFNQDLSELNLNSTLRDIGEVVSCSVRNSDMAAITKLNRIIRINAQPTKWNCQDIDVNGMLSPNVKSDIQNINPTHIALVDGGFLLYYSSASHVLVKFTWDSFQWKKELDHRVRYMTVSPDGRIILTSRTLGKSQVFVYNAGGEKLFVLPKNQERNGITVPKGVCTDSVGNMVIADYLTGSVRLYSRDGDLVRELVTDLPVGWSDMCVAIHNDRLLAVGGAGFFGGFLHLYEST